VGWFCQGGFFCWFFSLAHSSHQVVTSAFPFFFPHARPPALSTTHRTWTTPHLTSSGVVVATKVHKLRRCNTMFWSVLWFPSLVHYQSLLRVLQLHYRSAAKRKCVRTYYAEYMHSECTRNNARKQSDAAQNGSGTCASTQNGRRWM
jgi:hypothetical protein